MNHSRDRIASKQKIKFATLFLTISTRLKDKNEHLCTWLTERYPFNYRCTRRRRVERQNTIIMVILDEDNICFGKLYSICFKIVDFAASYLGGIRQLDAKQVLSR